MAVFHMVLSALFFCQRLGSAGSVCVTGCSCTDEAFGRSLLCMELPLGRIPQNIPENSIRIRIEQSHLSEIPRAAFAAVSALMFLWLNFNNITLMNVRSLEGLRNLTELRMQGNKLRSIPWTAFQDTPNLDILDLKHNRIDVLPEYALRLLPKLTYFDLSFNQLTIISRDVFLNWLRIQTHRDGVKEERANVVLALHGNRWLCDCRLKGFVEFINSISPPMILMNSYMTCSGPESRKGKFFHEVELNTCLKPETSSPHNDVNLPLGSKVTLMCLVRSRPEAVVRWSYSLKRTRAFTVSQTRMSDDTISSALIIPAVHVADRGVYICTANNFIGNSSVSVQLDVVLDHNSTFPPSPAFPLASVDESVYIDVHIAKQTMYGITIEWFAMTEKPAETWFTVYFGRHDASKKDAIHVGPGTNSYSVSDLLPLTKYEVCVTARNQPPRDGQCVVFVTGSGVNREQRARLVHILVVVGGMVLAVPAGICVCTSDTRTHCCERCAHLYQRHKQRGQRQEAFDGLQATGDEARCGDSAEVRKKRSSEQKTQKRNSSAQLY